MALQVSRILTARKTLVDFTVSDFPTLKKNSREKIHKSVHKTAYPQIHEPVGAPLSTEDLARIMSGMSNG